MSKHIFKNSGNHLPDFCRPAAELLASIGDKWTLPVLGNLQPGAMRFTELEAAVGHGISQRMLTLTLRSLERDGMVERAVHATIPPRVDYALSKRGLALLQTLGPLHEWAVLNHEHIAQSRRDYDARGQ